MLKREIDHARLSNKVIKGHSLRIGGATAYANSAEGGALTAGFMGLWASGSRWTCIQAYERPLERAGVDIGIESIMKLSKRTAVLGTYAAGLAP